MSSGQPAIPVVTSTLTIEQHSQLSLPKAVQPSTLWNSRLRWPTPCKNDSRSSTTPKEPSDGYCQGWLSDEPVGTAGDEPRHYSCLLAPHPRQCRLPSLSPTAWTVLSVAFLTLAVLGHHHTIYLLTIYLPLTRGRWRQQQPTRSDGGPYHRRPERRRRDVGLAPWGKTKTVVLLFFLLFDRH